MSSPPFDGEALLRALTAASVGFIVIGGVALGAHGFRRATKDIDIVPAPDQDNLRRLAGVLTSLEYSIMGTHEFESDELVNPDLEALMAGGNWVLSTKFGRLDILQFVEPDFDYSKLAPEAVADDVFGLQVRFCGYDHLVAMKEAAGRPQDLADLERLRAIRGESES